MTAKIARPTNAKGRRMTDREIIRHTLGILAPHDPYAHPRELPGLVKDLQDRSAHLCSIITRAMSAIKPDQHYYVYDQLPSWVEEIMTKPEAEG